jgi:hypothetical protein
MVEVDIGNPLVALCIFCEDGIPCPAAASMRAKSEPKPAAPPVPRRELKPRRAPKKAVRDLAQAIPQVSELVMPEKEHLTMAKEKKLCNAPDCGTLTASKVGYCGKHFYMSKLKGAPGAKKKARLTRKPTASNANGHASGNGDRLHVELSPAAIENYMEGLDLRSFIRHASPEIKARLFELVMEN